MTEPVMDSTTKRRCLVIGAGIVGSCCAWNLQTNGYQVTLLDRVEPGTSTSFGNAACLSPSQVVPFSHPGVWKKIPGWLRDPLGPLTIRWQHLPWVAPWLLRFLRAGNLSGVNQSSRAQAALMQRIIDDYHQLLEATGLTGLVRSRGALALYDTEQHFQAARWVHELEAEHGFDYRRLETDEIRALAPQLNLPDGVVLMLPSWQHTLDPGALTQGIAQAAFNAGANWQTGSVTRVEAGPEGVTTHLEGATSVQADVLVLAAGAWSNRIASQLDCAVPMTAKRGYHSMIADPGIELELPMISGSRSFVMTPMGEGLRLAGTAEFARLDAQADYRRAAVLVKHARDYLPGLQANGVTEWMGQRPMMVDSVPVISRSPTHSNVFYAFGHGHYGLTQGATTGKLITGMVSGREPELDMTPYRIDRFQ